MKYRIFLLLLSICVLLCACEHSSSEEDKHLSSHDHQAPAQEESPLSTQVPSTEEVLPPTGNAGVKADFSAYSPDEETGYRYSRLRNEPITDLEASDSYGAIYPYPGSYVYAEEEGFGSDDTQAFYGFVTTEGCIIADPVYRSVYLLEDALTEKATPFWCMLKLITDPEYTFGYSGVYRYAFASKDGSFVSPCVYAEIKVCGDRIFAFYPSENSETFRFEIYDSDCRLLLDSAEHTLAESFCDRSYRYHYSEGLYTVAINDSSGNVACYYMDESFNLVNGPFSYAYHFKNGKAMVASNSHTYYFIDREGNKLSESFYDFFEITPQYYIMKLNTPYGDSICKLYDHDLNMLAETHGYFIPQEDGGFYANEHRTVFTEGSELSDLVEEIAYYSAEGELLWEHSNCTPCTSRVILFDKGEEEENDCIMNLSTGQVQLLPNSDWLCETCGDPQQPFILLYHYDPDIDDILYYLYTEDLEELSVSERYPAIRRQAPDSPQEYMAVFPEDGHIRLSSASDTTYGTYPVSHYWHGAVYDEGIGIFSDESAVRMFNAQGELLFYYPIWEAMDD